MTGNRTTARSDSGHPIKERIFINIFSHNAGRLFEMVLGFLLIPFLIRRLGISGFGLIVLAESLIQFFLLAVSGLRGALARYVGICLYQKRPYDANVYIATAQGILIVIVGLLAAAGIIVWYFFPVLFSVPAEYLPQVKVFIAVMFVSFIIEMCFISHWSILYSLQRFDLLSLYNACRNIIRSSLCFIVYFLFVPKLYYYGFIYCAAIITEQLLVIRGSYRLFPQLRVTVQGFSPLLAKELFSFMGFRTIQFISGLLYTSTDMVLINRFFGAASNAIYSVSLKFIEATKRLIQRSLWVLTPSFTELLARREYERLARLYSSVTKAASLISLPVCILLLVFGKDLINVWVGEEFLTAVPLMYVNILAFFPLLIFTPAGGIMTAYAKIKIPSLVSLACAVANVIISLYCALILKWGLIGFCFGTLCATVIQDLVFTPYYSCRLIRMNLGRFVIDSFLKPLSLCCAFGLTLWYVKFIQKPPLVWSVCLTFGLTPLYAFGCWMFILNQYEQNKLKELHRGYIQFIFRKKKC